jgi:hypothetical protein
MKELQDWKAEFQHRPPAIDVLVETIAIGLFNVALVAGIGKIDPSSLSFESFLPTHLKPPVKAPSPKALLSKMSQFLTMQKALEKGS